MGTRRRFRHITGSGHSVVDLRTGDEVCRVSGMRAADRAKAVAAALQAGEVAYDEALQPDGDDG